MVAAGDPVMAIGMTIMILMVSGMTTILDKVIKLSGRWKSHAFERYLDQGQLFQLQLHSLKSRELRLKDVGAIGQ